MNPYTYDYEVLLDGDTPESERIHIFRNCLVDIQTREILFLSRDTGKELLRVSRRDVLRIDRLREGWDRDAATA